jgi:hypothetical protein
MGDAADDLMFQQMKLESLYKKAQELERKYNAGILYWSTPHEGKVKIQLLKTSHLVNIEKFLRRKRNVNNPVSEMWLVLLQREIVKRQGAR